ncbi:MAG: hypothetical protein H0W96_03675 [Solirubrobacterales bacterium]|nr:hypothetical protein [Solirubrobacterales bacterium]
MAIVGQPSATTEQAASEPVASEQITPGPPSGGWSPDKRFLGIAITVDIVALVLAYVAISVPLQGPKLTGEEVDQHWVVAAIGALIVAIGFTFVLFKTSRRPKAEMSAASAVVAAQAAAGTLPRVPRTLKFEITPKQKTKRALILSVAVLAPLLLVGAPPALIWFAMLAPLIPYVVKEARYKQARYGVFALFVLMGVLQMLHMVEHSVQVGQLVATAGDLSRSHGIFGQLDFEAVHFITDTLLWIGLGLLVTILRERNVWLWIAFIAASLHEVEHLYLFWLHIFDNNFYLAGGFNGIMGHNGIIGSPLDRPYLHYTYNLIVFVPMLIAIWDEARRMDVRHPQPASAQAAG